MLSNPNSQKTNKTPTVLFISHDYHLGGAGKSLLLAIKNIKSIRPIAACIQDGRFIEECKKAGIETQVFYRKFVYHKNKCLLRIGHLWEDLICFAKCWQFVKKKRIDLIHINSAMSFLVVFGIVGWLRCIPVVWHLRDIPKDYWVQRLSNFMVARFSSAIVCVSKAVRDRFGSTTKVPCKIEVVLNPLDINELPILANIIGENVVFGMPGQIAEWKRHKLFLEAALHVCKVCKDARVIKKRILIIDQTLSTSYDSIGVKAKGLLNWLEIMIISSNFNRSSDRHKSTVFNSDYTVNLIKFACF